MRLEGKKAIVTGASRGLGRAIALALAREGADVLVNYVSREEQAKELVAAIQEMGRRAIRCRADVSDTVQIRRMVEAAIAGLGRVDILVNNAGIGLPKGPLETTEAEWEKVLRTNLTGVFLCSQAVIPGMIAQGGGRIINISSMAGKSGTLGGSAYCAAKAGVIGLTKSLANALARHNILVNAIAPALIDTEILYWRTEEQWKETLESIPLKRLGNPNDLAEAAVYLASNGGNFMTGATLDVNGGLQMA
ncbi:MAG: 3-oxoacyl-ACP reductase FabG [candidate division NC10 bacterium]|nr:3-oxoacyl-ACP reductase FabG [candidate division NC10 bacterium]